MFTPNNTTDLDGLLDSIGSFYRNLDEDSKDRIKNFWKGMIDSVAGLYYDLRQNHLAKLLHYTQGYIEDRFKELNIIFSGTNKNVSDLKFSPPTSVQATNVSESSDQEAYVYTITSKTDYGESTPSMQAPLISGATTLTSNYNSITWSLVSGISSYGIYGRVPGSLGLLTTVSGVPYTLSGTYTFVDSGIYTPGSLEPSTNTATWGYLYNIPDNQCYMTIPTLSGANTGQILHENTDYEIEDLRKLKFIKPLSSGILPGYISYNTDNAGYEMGELFIANNAIALLPMVTNYYWKGLGIENVSDVTNEQLYYPRLSGIGEETYYDGQIKYAQHLCHWTYAMSNVVRKHPTMSNIRHGLALIMGLPFSYYNGTVIGIANDSNYKYITISGTEGIYTYEVTSTLNFQYEVDDEVTRFAILTDGTYASDYLDDFTLISGNTLREGQIKEFDLFTKVYSDDTHKFKLMESTGRDITKLKTGDEVTVEV
jgi:hypothetical protein